MTHDGNDEIRFSESTATFTVPMTIDAGPGSDVLSSGGGGDRLIGGEGADAYLFGRLAGGDDEIVDTAGQNGGDLNSISFLGHMSGVYINIGLTARQQANDGLSLHLSDGMAIYLVQGSDKDDTIIGNNRTNILFGNGGNDHIYAISTANTSGDILVGGDGDDELHGSNSDDLLIGDDFEISSGGTITGPEVKQKAFASLLSYEIHVGLTPKWSGADRIYGYGGTDFIIGGSGDDWIDSGTGGGLVFGDGFEVKLSNDKTVTFSDLKNLFKRRDSKGLYNAFLSFDLSVSLVGFGHDTIYGGADSDLLIGGDGHDYLDGKSGYDALFGNEGMDTLVQNNSVTYINGGSDWDIFIFHKRLARMTAMEAAMLAFLSDYRWGNDEEGTK
jgi:Ca2+-binding RTX toxin-like protein